MSKIITRFPPSPTGALHLGGARTALFNWLFARHVNGTFILRIEDTDQKRSQQAHVDSILESLKWMGIDWDQGPYFQTQRMDVYKKAMDRLLESGRAYWCTCSPETLAAKREAAMAKGDKPKYDGTCREMGLEKTEGAVVRLKTPLSGVTVFDDKVKGPVSVSNDELDDLVIQKSDGMPTYHMAVVADDVDMGITHIIRGDDHVSNTPRQICIYNALDEPLPVYAHVPMVLGPDKKKLSKRHGATSATEYREMGILPGAFINFLARLGWSHGDQEFFTVQELVEKFNLESIGKSASVFDLERLKDLNGDHIRAMDTDKLAPLVLPHLKKLGVKADNDTYLVQVVETLKIRSKTLEDMARGAVFYYQDEIEFDPKAAKKFLKPAAMEPVALLTEKLKDVDCSDEKALEGAFEKVMETLDIKLGKIAQPVRVALTGVTASPGIFEIIRVLGKDRVLQRLSKALSFIKERAKEAG